MAAALAALLAGGFVALAVIGAIRSYTPVPFWDMWEATLGFYISINEGASWLWWAQHNEHRIVLSRLLFWLDYEFFGGLGIFLLMMNYVIVALAVLLFRRISDSRLPDVPDRHNALFFITCFMVAWLYQWMQHENLAWAFQSQFFLAQLLPLSAFYWLHKSALPNGTHFSFPVACLLGVASVGTMANGVLALPLMAIYAIITRMRLWHFLTLSALSIFTLSLYYHDYQSPAYHGSITESLLQEPWQVIHFVLLYLGSPFFNLFGRGDIGSVVAIVATIFMAAVTFKFLFRSIKSPRNNTLVLALVFGIAYIAGTALGTAAGRITFGVYQAVSFRYSTPALMAWACLLMLLLPWLSQQVHQFPRRYITALVFFVALMLNSQWQAAQPQHQLVFDRRLAGLALVLDIKDEAQTRNILDITPGIVQTINAAQASNLGMFSMSPWRGLRDSLGETVIHDAMPRCAGHIDIVSTLDPDESHIAIQGWLFNSQQRDVPQLITVTDAEGMIRGYALTGQPRHDVAEAIHKNALLSGYRGYIPKELTGEAVTLIGDTAPCELTLEIPPPTQIP